jgi:hypothetical protein
MAWLVAGQLFQQEFEIRQFRWHLQMKSLVRLTLLLILALFFSGWQRQC